MDEIIAEYPSTDKKKQKIPAWKQSPLFQLQQNDVDADYWKTLMDRMNARRAEGTIPKPKSLPRRRAKTALDDVLEFIKERRQDEMFVPPPFDVEEEVYQPCERFITTSFRSTRDMATSPTRPPVTEQQDINSLSLLIRSDSNDSVKDIFEDEPNGHRTISQALQSMKPKSLPLRENSGGGHRNLEFQRTFDANVRVNEMISMVQSTPTANNRPYVKSLMSKLNIEPGGIAGRFTDIVKGAAKKRKQVPIVRGSSNDLTDDVLRAIEMPKRKNMAIGGTEPDVMFSESTFRLRETTIYPESSQGDIKIGYPRVPRVSSPETAKLPKSLGFDDVDTRESEPKKGSMGSIFF